MNRKTQAGIAAGVALFTAVVAHDVYEGEPLQPLLTVTAFAEAWADTSQKAHKLLNPDGSWDGASLERWMRTLIHPETGDTVTTSWAVAMFPENKMRVMALPEVSLRVEVNQSNHYDEFWGSPEVDMRNVDPDSFVIQFYLMKFQEDSLLYAWQIRHCVAEPDTSAVDRACDESLWMTPRVRVGTLESGPVWLFDRAVFGSEGRAVMADADCLADAALTADAVPVLWQNDKVWIPQAGAPDWPRRWVFFLDPADRVFARVEIP